MNRVGDRSVSFHACAMKPSRRLIRPKPPIGSPPFRLHPIMIHEGQGAFTRTLHTAPQDPQEQGAEETVTFAPRGPLVARSLSRRFRPIFGLPDVFRTSSKAGPDWPSKADPVLLKLEGVLSPASTRLGCSLSCGCAFLEGVQVARPQDFGRLFRYWQLAICFAKRNITSYVPSPH